jgi:Spy/CpxP family protein refolding chaperone
MNFKLVVTIAAAALLIGTFAGVTAAQTGDQADEQYETQAAPPEDAPAPGDQPTFKCPRCGAECTAPHARRGRGMRAPRAPRGYYGNHHRGFRNDGRGFYGRGGGVPADRMLRSTERLELTDEQVAQLKKLSYDAKSKLIDLESSLEKAQLEMKQQMDSDGDDLAAMKKQLNAMAKIKVDIQELKLKNWIDAKNVLNEDQKQKVKSRGPRFGSRL